MNNDTYAHRRAFYLLKKYSSYTWSEQMFKLTKEFGVAFETLLRKPPVSFAPVNDMDEEIMNLCWTACGEMEEGLALLQEGNRLIGYDRFGSGAPFGSDLLFGNTDRGSASRYVQNDTNFAKYRRIGYSDDYKVVSTGMFEPLEKLSNMESYRGTTCHVWSDNAWNHVELINYYRWPNTTLDDIHDAAFPIPRWLPDSLPAVPQPIADAPMIVSGDEVPVTGIWQPEFLKPMTTSELKAWDVISENYCMNFLVQGNTAPEMNSQEMEEAWFVSGAKHYYDKRPKGMSIDRPVRWRLIWCDERYGDKGIPEEERDYLRMDESGVTEVVRADRVRGLPGEEVAKTGYWWTPSLQETKSIRFFNKGDHFPSTATTEYGDVIWYYDPQQQSDR